MTPVVTAGHAGALAFIAVLERTWVAAGLTNAGGAQFIAVAEQPIVAMSVVQAILANAIGQIAEPTSGAIDIGAAAGRADTLGQVADFADGAVILGEALLALSIARIAHQRRRAENVEEFADTKVTNIIRGFVAIHAIGGVATLAALAQDGAVIWWCALRIVEAVLAFSDRIAELTAGAVSVTQALLANPLG
mgnify:CR=1 FL=1